MFGFFKIATIRNKNPIKETTGANWVLLALKISGSKWVSVDEGPVMSRNPLIIIRIPTIVKMKFILSNANFFFFEIGRASCRERV